MVDILNTVKKCAFRWMSMLSFVAQFVHFLVLVFSCLTNQLFYFNLFMTK